MKPVEMIADAIRDVSGRGEIGLDAVGGSGSTLIAAEKTARPTGRQQHERVRQAAGPWRRNLRGLLWSASGRNLVPQGAVRQSKGRPKGSRNIATLLDGALNQTITVTEQGCPKRVRKGEALVAAPIAKALRGDVRAADLVLRQIAAKVRALPAPIPGLRPEDLSDEEPDAAIVYFLSKLDKT